MALGLVISDVSNCPFSILFAGFVARIAILCFPVADAVRGFLFHRKKSMARHCIRNSSLRFVQQSPFISDCYYR